MKCHKTKTQLTPPALGYNRFTCRAEPPQGHEESQVKFSRDIIEVRLLPQAKLNGQAGSCALNAHHQGHSKHR